MSKKNSLIVDIEPTIYRQRLIMEGHYLQNVDGDFLRSYLTNLSATLKMRIFAGPFAWPPDSWTHPDVLLHDWNAFVAWTESGCQAYAWKNARFFTVDAYSCKAFDVDTVVEFTRESFQSQDLIHLSL